MRLRPAAAAAGVGLVACETLPSTNAEALELARRGESGALWVTARQQTAGRGRRGNTWISPAGNLYATLLLSDPSVPERAAELSFVAALAVHDAITGCDSRLARRLTLKWPNDVLCDGAKIAGILIESESVAGRLAVAIGVGVNCLHHPAHTEMPATDLAAAGAVITAGELFGAMSGAMLRRLGEWRRGDGFAAMRAAWVERAGALGGAMRVRLATRELYGRGEGLDERGRLLLRLADGSVQLITAGDVFPVATPDQSGPRGHEH
jgi:BirA family biotin operon repressor/biotin-[acetyl-CoA-carboxylase] ligase